MENINIKVDAVDPEKLTPTELILDIQRLNFHDQDINVKMAAMLRRVADDIKSRRIGVTKLKTASTVSVDHFPGITFEIEFIDYEHDKKSKAKLGSSK